jgi:hypothetical protein
MSNNSTAADRARFSRIASLGCIACWQDGNYGTPGEIHHCKKHGYRDHKRVVCICPTHHKMTSAVPGVLNRHKNPIEFAARYGSDDELHHLTKKLLGEKT